MAIGVWWRPAENPQRADWIRDGSYPAVFDRSGNRWMAQAFTHTVRILHPAYLNDRPVRWEDIGSRTGHTLNMGSSWYDVSGSTSPNHVVEHVFDCPPEQGSLPALFQEPLYECLATVSTGLLWNGYNDPEARRLLDLAPSTQIDTAEFQVLEASDSNEYGFELAVTPNYWWPEDHSWCAATGIDLFDTLVATSDTRLTANIMAIPGIEALMIPSRS